MYLSNQIFASSHSTINMLQSMKREYLQRFTIGTNIYMFFGLVVSSFLCKYYYHTILLEQEQVEATIDNNQKESLPAWLLGEDHTSCSIIERALLKQASQTLHMEMCYLYWCNLNSFTNKKDKKQMAKILVINVPKTL